MKRERRMKVDPMKSSETEEEPEFHEKDAEQEVLSVINAEEDVHARIFWKASLFDDRATAQITDRDWVSPQKDPHIHTDTVVRTVFGASKLRRELPTNSRRFALGRGHTTHSFHPSALLLL